MSINDVGHQHGWLLSLWGDIPTHVEDPFSAYVLDGTQTLRSQSVSNPSAYAEEHWGNTHQ